MSTSSTPHTREGKVPEVEHMAYVGYCAECGGMIAASVDDPKYKRETAKFVKELVRDGCNVQRVTCQFVRDNLTGCTDTCPCKSCVRDRAEEAAKATVQEALL